MTQRTDQHAWILRVKARGLGDMLGVALDALEPLGPLGAQMLWVAQPVGSVFGWRDAIADLANALETPDGIDTLRQLLEDDSHGEGPP
jgi:hypothetical protein